MPDDGEVDLYREAVEAITCSVMWEEIVLLQHVLAMAESPIERMMLANIWVAAPYILSVRNGSIVAHAADPEVPCRARAFGRKPFEPDTLTVEPQARIGEYRVDLKLTYVYEMLARPPRHR